MIEHFWNVKRAITLFRNSSAHAQLQFYIKYYENNQEYDIFVTYIFDFGMYLFLY